eukprot:1248519-Rhodomonas_salina.1
MHSRAAAVVFVLGTPFLQLISGCCFAPKSAGAINCILIAYALQPLQFLPSTLPMHFVTALPYSLSGA